MMEKGVWFWGYCGYLVVREKSLICFLSEVLSGKNLLGLVVGGLL